MKKPQGVLQERLAAGYANRRAELVIAIAKNKVSFLVGKERNGDMNALPPNPNRRVQAPVPATVVSACTLIYIPNFFPIKKIYHDINAIL